MPLKKIAFVFFFFLIVPTVFAQKSPFRVSAPESSIIVQPGEKKTVTVGIEIPPGHFVYQEKTKIDFLDLKEIQIEKVEFPSVHLRKDPFFKKTLEVFEGDSSIAVTFAVPVQMEGGERGG